MKTGVIVQARMNSTRLPDKMVKMIQGKTLLERSLEAAGKIPADEYILAIPYGYGSKFFRETIKENGFSLIYGPEEDVLERFCIAIEKFNLDTVIRCTGDKIFYYYEYIDKLLEVFHKKDLDFVGYNEKPLESLTPGIYSAKALLKARNIGNDYCHEHIKPCFGYSNWSINILPVPNRLKKFKLDLSIDTYEDLERIRTLFSEQIDRQNMKKILKFLMSYEI